MKKLLLTTALVGVAFVATPAMAEVELGLGGHFKGYVTWNDQDEDGAVWADANADGVVDAGEVGGGVEARSFDMVRDTEIHFTGETTLDNGLTVGFHAENTADGGEFATQESYAYFAGNWGRVNVGAEDGAAYLLQVAAPAADSNIDGIRQYVNPVNYALADDGVLDANGDGTADGVGFDFTALTGTAIDYAQDDTGYADKLTYISPVFNGFQAAASYTFDTEDLGTGYADSFGVRQDDLEDDFGEAWELAGRYEGVFNAVRLALGAGYTRVNVEEDATAAVSTDDQDSWNLGANVGFGPFNVGAVYVETNDLAGANNIDNETWVIGADYTTGPFVIGASYYSGNLDLNNTDELDTDRFSGGVTYTYGPGMSFRGSVHHVEHEADGFANGDDMDATSLLLGTQINF